MAFFTQYKFFFENYTIQVFNSMLPRITVKMVPGTTIVLIYSVRNFGL
jgi:hypothetical protein